jgi:hypothetical protein
LAGPLIVDQCRIAAGEMAFSDSRMKTLLPDNLASHRPVNLSEWN